MSDDPAPASVPARARGGVKTACKVAREGGKAGKSRVEIASDLNMSLRALQALEARHSTLKIALATARDQELAWWEKQAREGVSQGTKFNAALWARCMAARFPEQNYGEAEVAQGQPPPDPRERAKAVAALLSALQTGGPAEAPETRETKPAGRGRGPKVQDSGADPRTP